MATMMKPPVDGTTPAELPDFDAFPIYHRVTGASANGTAVDVVWDDGLESRYHVFVLKESAPDICHPVTREQATQLVDIPADLTATDAGVDGAGGLWVAWSSGGISRFHPGWLRAYAPGAPDDLYALPAQKLWDGGLGAELPRLDGDRVLNTLEGLGEWVEALHVYGAAIVENLPTDESVIQTVPALIGPIRETNFGSFFTVESKADADSNAYTTMTLPVHSDLCTREYEPGLQFLHCARNDADGGESELADGYFIAEHIRQVAPDEYKMLTTVPITFFNKAKDHDYRWDAPMFGLDREGKVHDVRWSPWLRAPLRCSHAEADILYRGLRRAFTLGNDPAFKIKVKLKPGELLGFDNRRVLHGRNGYDPSTGGRLMRGCYVEREEVLSSMRIMARKRRQLEVDNQ